MKKTLKKAVFGVDVKLLDQASPEVHMTSEVFRYVNPHKKRKREGQKRMTFVKEKDTN